MLRSKLYGHLNDDESTVIMESSKDGNDEAADASHPVNSLDRPRPSLLDQKIEASMRSIKQRQSMRQLTTQGNGVVTQGNGVGSRPARAESHRNLGEKPTTGNSKSSSRPNLSKRFQSTREMTTGTDIFKEVKQEQKSATASPKRPGLKGHRAQSSRLAVYQNKSASRSSGRPKRKMETSARASPETDFNLSRETAKARPAPASARRAARRSSLTERKTDKSKMPVAPQEMDFADFANCSWKRENPKEQTTAKSKVPEAHQEMDFADFAKQKKGGKSSRPKVAREMDVTSKREPTQKSDTNDTEFSPVREKSSRRSSLSRQMQKSPSARRSSHSRELLQSPSMRRLSQSRDDVMTPRARRSLQSRDAQGKRVMSRAKLPVSPEMKTAAVATSEHVNKESIGEIAKLLKGSKRVHTENQQLEEEKKNAHLAKIRARRSAKIRTRRRAEKAPLSPDHTVATHWERNPSMGLQEIPTM
jgi:hypothetical protein